MNSHSSIKILYLTYDGLTDHIGQSQILPYLLKSAEKGIKIRIISFEKPGKVDRVIELKSFLNEKNIDWDYITFSEGGNLSKLNDFIKFVFTAFKKVRNEDIQIIHSRSYVASIVGLILKIIFNKKLIFDKRDFWIDAKVETGRLRFNKISHKVIHSTLRFFEKQLFLKSDHIISLTERAKRIILKKYLSRKEAEITVIPCCVDLTLFDNSKVQQYEIDRLKSELGLKGSKVLGYVGSIGPAYMIPELLDCFKVLNAHIPNLKLLFLVNNDESEVNKIVESKNISKENVTVTSAGRNSMPLYISVFDAAIYFIMPSFAKQATSPTKLSEILAMKKPVITNKGVGDVEVIFQKLQCGYLINEFSESEYKKAASWLTNEIREIHPDLDNYSLEWGANKYYSVYKSLAV